MGGDLRHAWRAIRSMPVVASVVVLSLGIGIGVNTAVFSWLQAVVLRPLPGVVDSATLMLVEPVAETGSYPRRVVARIRRPARAAATFSDLIAFRMVPFTVGETGGSSARTRCSSPATTSRALGLSPPRDGSSAPTRSCARAASGDRDLLRLLAVALRRRDRSAIGRSIRVNGQLRDDRRRRACALPGTVLGLNFDMWAPATLAPTADAAARASSRIARCAAIRSSAGLRRGARARRRRASSIARCAISPAPIPDTNAKHAGRGAAVLAGAARAAADAGRRARLCCRASCCCCCWRSAATPRT